MEIKEKIRPFFPDDLPAIKFNRELDAVKERLRGLDEYYVASGCIPDRRALFEAMWGVYEPFADADFLHQHRLSFHQRTWEMYLGYMLLRRGFKLERIGKNMPDLCLNTSKGKLWIEAVAPGHGNGADRVPEIRIGVGQSVDFERIALRVSSALDEKFKKLEKYLSDGTVSKNEPYVIAVNRGFYSIGDPYEMPLVMQCLFGVGPLTIAFSPGRTATSTYYARRNELPKTKGGTVPMTFFENPAHAPVSAVIYSTQNVLNAAPAGIQNPKKLGRDCVVIHNPLAANPIPLRRFGFLTQYRIDKEGFLRKV